MRLLKFLTLIIFSTQFIMSAQEVVAYWGASPYGYYVKNIEATGSAKKITVLNYAFAVPGPDSAGNIVATFRDPYPVYVQPYTADMSIDGTADDSAQQLRGQFNQLKKLKTMNPNLKILLSIGGWGGCTYFSDAALTEKSRETFVDDCINKFILGNLPVIDSAGGMGAAAGIFDGFDIDWEFPLSGGPEGMHYNPEDKENYTKLIKQFRKKLDAIRPGLLLTAAVPADKPNINNFDIAGVQNYLNWFNLMTYDFHGIWDNVTGHHTNLLSSPNDTAESGGKLSFDKSVKYFLDTLRVKNYKIVPGAAFYGKAWGNVNSTNEGLYQAGKDSGRVLKPGMGNYSSIPRMLSDGFNYYWDTLAMAPFLYNKGEKIFFTFDDAKSISLKRHYVDAYKLRGIMCWEISGDDSLGTLINTMYTGRMPEAEAGKIQLGKSTPIISITYPRNKKEVAAGTNLIINTYCEDKNNQIIKVEFYGDGLSLGYCTKAPFDWAWFNMPEGEHTLKAIATDSYGNKGVSQTVKFAAVKSDIEN